MKWDYRRQAVLVAALLAVVSTIARSVNAEQAPGPADFEYNDLKFAKDLRSFQQAGWVQTYLTMGHRDEAWDKPAKDFLETFCHYASYELVWRGIRPDDVPSADAVRKLGNDVINLKCDDPQVRAAYGALLFESGNIPIARRELRAALVAMNDGKHPAYNILYVCNQLLQIDRQTSLAPDARATIDSAAVDASVRCMCNVPPTRAERYIRFRMIHMIAKDRPRIEDRIVKLLVTAKDVDPWLLGVFMGEYQTHLAWAARGTGTADTVTKDGWQGFEKHLQNSHTLLMEAWKIDPAIPGPAALMITVAMGLGAEGEESPRAWYIRSRSAKMDDRWALESMLWSLRPRWGGSYEELISLGQEFVSSKRFDTQVPAWMLETAWSISADRAQPLTITYAQPEIYKPLKEMFDGYAAALPAGPGRDWVLSEQALVATAGGHYADARAVVDQVGTKLDRRVFQSLSGNVDRTISQVYAYTGPHEKEARAATHEAETLDANAIKHFADLAAMCQPHDPEAYYYNSYLTEMRFKAEFAESKWVDVQPKDVLYLWSPIHGNWETNGEKLIGVCDGSGLMLRFGPMTGDAFELEAKLEYEPTSPGANACGIFCDHNGQTWANGVFYSVGFHDVSWYGNGKTGVVSHPLEKVNLLHLTMSAGKLTATFNGEPVPIPAMTPPARDLGANARVCIAGLYPDSQLNLVVTDLKVRKLVPGQN